MVRGPKRSGNTITEKLREYLYYAVQGVDDGEIAEKLDTSQVAIRNRRKRIMDITGCLTHDDIIRYAKEQAYE